jgi:hypothetical protein
MNNTNTEIEQTSKELEDALLEEQQRLEELEELEEQAYLKSIIQVTNNKSILCDFTTKIDKKISPKVPKVTKVNKNKNVLSLSDFTKKIDEEVKLSQPKKFTSKRADIKRKELGLDNEIIKRTFNARKPPYNFVNRTNNINIEVNISNTDDFPCL